MQLPGIEKYPDLVTGLRRELSRIGCSSCDRVAIIKKYQALIASRDAGERTPQNTLETLRR